MSLVLSDAAPTTSATDLELAILTIENSLEALGAALRQHDGARVERCAAELQRALAEALQISMLAARRQSLPPALRQRLARASGQVAAQREVLARATAALDRAIDVLLPSCSAAPLSPSQPDEPLAGAEAQTLSPSLHG